MTTGFVVSACPVASHPPTGLDRSLPPQVHKRQFQVSGESSHLPCMHVGSLSSRLLSLTGASCGWLSNLKLDTGQVCQHGHDSDPSESNVDATKHSLPTSMWWFARSYPHKLAYHDNWHGSSSQVRLLDFGVWLSFTITVPIAKCIALVNYSKLSVYSQIYIANN
jgi:hypothetical protein